jgi:uncharacterized protein (DUF305 family)
VTTERAPEELADTGASGGSAAAIGSVLDPAAGWTTAKVVLLVLATSFLAVVLSLTLADRLGGTAEDSVDVGFLRDMIHHHEQAVQLGIVGSANTVDPDVNNFALEAVIAQQYEIGYMEAILEEWGHGRGEPDRAGMVWMDMPTSLGEMPGMADEEDVAGFRGLEGEEADGTFLQLMTEHHRGGIHMAEFAAENASDPRVVELARRMVSNQSAEIREYAVKARSLGVSI